MDVETQFRGWLREALEQSGKSHADLAEALGIGRSAVTKMLSGTRSIKLVEQKNIEDYFLSNGITPFGGAESVKLVPTGPDLRFVFATASAGDDYLLVLTHAALVEQAIWERTGRKVDVKPERVRALVGPNFLSEGDLNAIENLFRLRDVFVHSTTARSLEEQSLAQLARDSITSSAAAPEPGNGRQLRKAFAASASMTSYLISFGSDMLPSSGQQSSD